VLEKVKKEPSGNKTEIALLKFDEKCLGDQKYTDYR